MTREEAIKIIQNEYKCVDRECDIEKSCGKCPYMMPTKEPILKAYEMAIQALSQEPCELLIIKSNIFLHQDDRKKWTESIKREKENGVIILPPYFEPLLVPANIEINIEQEPCDDAISREDVIKLVECSEYELQDRVDNDAMCDDVRELPSVTQKPGKWINVNDMLPREREDVIVTCFVHENWQTKIGYWNGKAWVVNAYDILFIDRLEVTAWMPLPEPYKAESEENK